MSHISPASLVRPSFKSVPRTAAASRPTPAPVLITEQEVAFSTAAAAPIITARRRWLETILLADLGRILTALKEPRPHYPRREPYYLEAARISRAMERL